MMILGSDLTASEAAETNTHVCHFKAIVVTLHCIFGTHCHRISKTETSVENFSNLKSVKNTFLERHKTKLG